MKTNDIKFTITVGHSDREGNPLPVARRVRAFGYAQRAMARLCGGVTSNSGTGMWVNPDGEIVHETVTSLCTIFTEGDPDETASAIDGIARSLASMLDQHTIMVERAWVAMDMVGPK